MSNLHKYTTGGFVRMGGIYNTSLYTPVFRGLVLADSDPSGLKLLRVVRPCLWSVLKKKKKVMWGAGAKRLF